MAFEGVASTLFRLGGRPPLLYGTAWKKEDTTRLVKEALAAGFTVVDTAGQPKHYREDLVGNALREVFREGKLKREDIFLQTKFTSPQGQNLDNMPYDPNSPLETQVRTSIASSLHNLRPDDNNTTGPSSSISSSSSSSYLDCVLLHSPLRTTAETLQAWRVLESYVPTQQIRHLGISNTTLEILREVYDSATVKPAVVQNRFYPATRYDGPLREYCAEKGIVYESFWTLTGNPELMNSEPVGRLSKEAGVVKEVALYSLVIELGVAVLNGTTSQQRMKGDLVSVAQVRNWSFVYADKWRSIVEAFRALVEPDHHT